MTRVKEPYVQAALIDGELRYCALPQLEGHYMRFPHGLCKWEDLAE